jgi:hypothetical protein
MLAPCGLNLHLYIFFKDYVQKQIININNKTKENLNNFLIHTDTHQIS